MPRLRSLPSSPRLVSRKCAGKWSYAMASDAFGILVSSTVGKSLSVM